MAPPDAPNAAIGALRPGLRHTRTLVVGPGLLVPAVSPAFTGFADMPPVFATAFLVGFVEWTCVEALRPFVPAGLRTVGTHIALGHTAATPAGLRVNCEVELRSVQGRQLCFDVVCRDEVEVIGTGQHRRALVDLARFMERVHGKARQGRRPTDVTAA